jgi:NADPH:quinone reductase-like Zn-dependent oxidoreductase
MKVYEIQNAFGIDNLNRAERAEAAPGPKQIAVKVKAVSINYRDLLLVQGFYNPKQPLPIVPFSDGAGEMVEVGEGVSQVQTGRPRRQLLLPELGFGSAVDTGEGAQQLGHGLPAGRHARRIRRARGKRRSETCPTASASKKARRCPAPRLTAWSCLFRHEPESGRHRADARHRRRVDVRPAVRQARWRAR